jgi:hypothetical protein
VELFHSKGRKTSKHSNSKTNLQISLFSLRKMAAKNPKGDGASKKTKKVYNWDNNCPDGQELPREYGTYSIVCKQPDRR